MTINCYSCIDYEDGKGKPSCLSCPEVKSWKMSNRQGLLGSGNCVRLEKAVLENLTNPEQPLKSIFDCLPLMTEKYATALLQLTLLGLSHPEIARYHSIDPKTAHRWTERAERELRALLQP